MKALLVALLVSVSLGLHCWAEDPGQFLASIPDFAFGGVGVAGITSKGELAVRELMAKPTAKGDFLKLLETGNPQAKCYALVALRKLNPEVYASKIEAFKKDKTEVHTIGGCIVGVAPMYSVAANIDAGRYDHYLEKRK